MKIKELKKILNQSSHQDEQDVKVILSVPSIGPTSTTKVTDVSFGFDWNSGLLINTEEPVVIKNERQTIFEESYSLLMKIATESFTVKEETKYHKDAKRILNKLGISNYVIKSYVHLYHK